MRNFVLVLITILAAAPRLQAAETISKDDPVYQDLLSVRKGLIAAYQQRDIDSLLSYCDESIVVTWQNAEVSNGQAEVRAYYKKMMEGDDRIVDDLTANPTVDGLAVLYNGDTAVSRGAMNDVYRLRDGSNFALNSRWSATLTKQDGKWLVAAFHASTNAFDNDLLKLVATKSLTLSGGIGLALGLLLGAAGAWLALKRRSSVK